MRLAADPDGLGALRRAAAAARGTAADHLPGPAGEVLVDIDGTLITAHSEKQDAAPTYKRGFGFHPLLAYADHGAGGTGEPVAALLRPGNANAGTAADHQAVLDLVEAQLTDAERAGLVVRTDTAACTHAFLQLLTDRGHGYTVGFYARADVAAAIEALPDDAWVPCTDDEAGAVRDGAWVAEITGLLDLSKWPPGMRVIARKERPHPGAQLRLTDADGHRVTCFATNSTSADLPALDLRHRRRARCEDRIRNAKDTGARNLPYQLRRRQRGLAADRHARPTAHRPAAAPRPARRPRGRGAETAAAAAVRPRRPAGPHRPKTHPRPRPDWPWTPAILAAGQRLDALTA